MHLGFKTLIKIVRNTGFFSKIKCPQLIFKVFFLSECLKCIFLKSSEILNPSPKSNVHSLEV